VPAAADTAKADARRSDDLIAAMRAAEAKLRSVSLRMTTEGRLPGGLVMSVRGELCARYGDDRATYARFTYATGDGLRGAAESAQTAAGITLREDDPSFGDMFVAIDPALVADLEWAGRVLQRDDLPGMPVRSRTLSPDPSLPLSPFFFFVLSPPWILHMHSPYGHVQTGQRARPG
jgi:hypothetical protein